jgi:hypothetical protein
VSNLLDSGTGSLRQAIIDANTTPDGGQPDTITFDSRVHGTITLESELCITDPDRLTIDGPGANRLAISGNNASRVFDISSGAAATIDGLTITHGLANKDAPVLPSFGGGILNFGDLTLLSDVLVSDNLAIGDVTANPYGRNGSAAGGGIYNHGTLSVSYSTFSRNQARGASGSSGGPFPGAAVGGGLANTGVATVTDSHFTGNLAQGGNNCTSGSSFAGNAGGGAILNFAIDIVATLTVTDSTFTNNRAIGGNDNRSPRFPGHSFGGAIGSNPLGKGPTFAVLVIGRSTFDHNQAIGGNDNHATTTDVMYGPGLAGGVVFVSGRGTISDSTFDHNQAIGGQGGDSNYGGEGHGGGIAVGFAGTIVTVSNCTVEHNQAIGGQGGGLYLAPGGSACLDSFTQSHVTDNHASTSDDDIFGTFTTCL